MANEVFVDTSGFYAILISDDDRHREANGALSQVRRRRIGLVTSDHVLGETATLLKARGKRHLLPRFFELILSSTACRIEWTDSTRFRSAVDLLLKRDDQDWSFTDCLSFVVMRERKLRKALTKDVHFEHAGFQRLLR